MTDVAALERVVLGSMMAGAVDQVAEHVTSGDFADPRHQVVYAYLIGAWADGRPTEPTALAHQLAAAGELPTAGGGAYLAEVFAAAQPQSAGWYARQVRDAAELRAGNVDGLRLSQIADSGDVDKLRAYRAELAEAWSRGPVARESDSWAPVDLGPYLRGEVKRPEPCIGLRRSDGLQLLYPGKEHSVVGEMEAGKSWFCLACVAAEMAEDRTCLYVHFEESDPSDTVERLLALGCPEWQIGKLFRFVAPERQVSRATLDRLLDPVPSLVVFDGVNEAMGLHGWDSNAVQGAAEFRRHLIAPCTRVGAATLSADHVVKDPERRTRSAIGSVHKGNGLSGALVLLENAEPFGRGQRGRSHVYVTKDRPGHLRRNGEGTKVTGKTFMGELVVDDSQARGPELYLNFWAPKPKAEQEAPVQEDPDEAAVLGAVRSIIAAGGRATTRAVRASVVGISNARKDDALTRLVLAGRLVEQTGSRSARFYTVPPTVPGDQLPTDEGGAS